MSQLPKKRNRYQQLKRKSLQFEIVPKQEPRKFEGLTLDDIKKWLPIVNTLISEKLMLFDFISVRLAFSLLLCLFAIPNMLKWIRSKFKSDNS
jgi:hypothetical protein